MTRLVVATGTATLLLLGVSHARADVKAGQPTPSYAVAHKAAVKYRAQRDWYAHRTTYWKRRAIREHRMVLHRPSSLEALRLASVVYRVDFARLYRIASCESTGSPPAYPASDRTLYAHAKNPGSDASGLLQFMPGTFASTPFGGFSIWSPYANALAGAWMMGPAQRGSEWVCQ